MVKLKDIQKSSLVRSLQNPGFIHQLLITSSAVRARCLLSAPLAPQGSTPSPSCGSRGGRGCGSCCWGPGCTHGSKSRPVLPSGHSHRRASLGTPEGSQGGGHILLPGVFPSQEGTHSPMGHHVPPLPRGRARAWDRSCCPPPCPSRPPARQFCRLTGSVLPGGELWPHGTTRVPPAGRPAHPGEHLSAVLTGTGMGTARLSAPPGEAAEQLSRLLTPHNDHQLSS